MNFFRNKKTIKSKFISRFYSKHSYNFICSYFLPGVRLSNYFSKGFSTKNNFFKDRINYREIETSERIKKLTEDLYFEQLNTENKETWLNYPTILDSINPSINTVHQLVIKDVINRIKLNSNIKVSNCIFVENKNLNEEEVIEKNLTQKYFKNNILKLKNDLLNLGILFNTRKFDFVNTEAYENAIQILKILTNKGKVELKNSTVYYNPIEKKIVPDEEITISKKISKSFYIKFPVENDEKLRFISSFDENKFESESLKKIAQEKNLNFIGFMTEIWRYVGVHALEVSENTEYIMYLDIDKDELFIVSKRRLPEVLKKMGIKISSSKKSNQIIIITEFLGSKIIDNKITVTELLFNRKLPLIKSFNLTKKNYLKRQEDSELLLQLKNDPSLNLNFYGSGFNILCPGHDKVSESICLYNDIYNYEGYVNDDSMFKNLGMSYSKKISNEFIESKLFSKKMVLAIGEHIYQNKLNNNQEIYEKTVLSCKIFLDTFFKKELLREMALIKWIPGLKFKNVNKKILKTSYIEEEVSSYNSLVENIDNINEIIISEIFNNTNNQCFIPLIKNNGKYVLDLNKTSNEVKEKEIVFSQDFLKFCSWLTAKKEFMNECKGISNIDKVEKALIQKQIITNRIENLEVSNKTNIEEFLLSIFNKSELIEYIWSQDFDIRSDISVENKNSHKSSLLVSSVVNFILNGCLPFDTIKTTGDILSKSGLQSQANFTEIIEGTEIFNFFKLQEGFFDDKTEAAEENFGYGADALRLILASNDLDNDIVLIENDLMNSKNDIREIRKMGRFYFILSTLKKGDDINFFNEMRLTEEWMIFHFVLFLEKLNKFNCNNDALKPFILEILDFIHNHYIDYLMNCLRKISDNKESGLITDKEINTLIFINEKILKTLITVMQPFIPFNCDYISNLISDEIKIKSIYNTEDFKNLIKLTEENQNLLSFKYKYLKVLKELIRKTSVATSKANFIPIKDLIIALEIEHGNLEEIFFFENENILKYFFNVKDFILLNKTKYDKKMFKELFNKETKLLIPEVEINKNKIYETGNNTSVVVKCIILIPLNYEAPELNKEDYYDHSTLFSKLTTTNDKVSMDPTTKSIKLKEKDGEKIHKKDKNKNVKLSNYKAKSYENSNLLDLSNKIKRPTKKLDD